ncbi:MAG: DUF4097 domain-containing protein [bacterium]|nr:DUF4097 domain-containing protein [bacterium]
MRIKHISNIMKFFITAVLIITLIIPSFAQVKRETVVLDREITKTFDFEDNGLLSVDNVNGSITISSWNSNKIEVEVVERRRGDYEVEIDFSYSNNRLRINTNIPRGSFRKSALVNYRIKVPEKIEIMAETTNGGVEIENIKGDVEAQSTNGNVVIINVESDVEAKTTNGNIELEDIVGSIDASTTNQSITIRGADSEDISATTTNGNIKADFDLKDDGFYRMRTTNGSIVLTIPDESKVDVDISCRIKNFRTDFDISGFSRRGEDRWNRNTTRRIRGRINGGGATLSAGTTNGGVTLRSK